VGKPVVTFELDGAPEVIRDGVSGFLVAPLDCRTIADRVVTLFRDPELRGRMGLEGRAFATAHFAVETMVCRVNDVYWQCLARRFAGGVRGGTTDQAGAGMRHS
jgi:glycosyltransferase involved in cell wall biosynthesis